MKINLQDLDLWLSEIRKLICSVEQAGMKVFGEPITFKYRPTEEELQKCIEFGKKYASEIKKIQD